jgi:hypothetical protein
MTIEELIAELQDIAKHYPGEKVYCVDHDDGKFDPDPEYHDWGDPNDPDKGVYL